MVDISTQREGEIFLNYISSSPSKKIYKIFKILVKKFYRYVSIRGGKEKIFQGKKWERKIINFGLFGKNRNKKR